MGLYLSTILFTFSLEGYNNFNQIGVLSNSYITVPTKVSMFDGIASNIACGGYHSVLLTTDHRVFAAGTTSEHSFFRSGANTSEEYEEINGVIDYLSCRKNEQVFITCGIYCTIVYTLPNYISQHFPFLACTIQGPVDHLHDISFLWP